MLSIRLLGIPQIVLDQRPLTVTRRKSRALLYYLAVQPEPVTRDHLLAFFWPDHERPAAQRILRTTLYNLRKLLSTAILAEEDTLALTPEAGVDVRTFETQLSLPYVEQQQLAATLDLYRGDFLSGFTLPDPPEFDDWVMVERERYRRLAVKGLTVLSQLYESGRDFRAALEALERALAFNPLQEDLQRACLRLHYLAGDRAGAIRRYEYLTKLLDEEMGVPPMDETRALYDAIITDTLPRDQVASRPDDRVIVSSRPTFSPAIARPLTLAQFLPFTGRTAELQKLQTLATAHKLILIEGEPGIGKTRLIEEFIQTSRRYGQPGQTTSSVAAPPQTLSLFGQARELEHALPYQPIIEALRNLPAHPEWPAIRLGLDLPPVWLVEAARLLPELAAAVPGSPPSIQAADESRLWEGVHQLLLAVARQRPVIFALDDLHWADASTLGLLGYLVRQASRVAAPLFFVAATRPITPRSPLAILYETLMREGHLERLPLERLTPEDVTALARHLSANHTYPLANWLNQSAEGNPFILAELVRYAREQDILGPDGSLNLPALPTSPTVPQTVYALIQSRLARLSQPARRVLDAAVAVGREFDFEIVTRAAALSDNAALDALDELQAVGLISTISSDGLRFAFDHSLTMEVAYREVGELRHRLLHRRVAEALENIYRNRLDSVAGLLAQHFAEGHAPGRAAKYAFQAGQQAAHLAAWAEAIGFYEQALAGADEGLDDPQRQHILLALGEACIQAGKYERAIEALRAASTLARSRADVVGENSAQIALAYVLMLQARFSEVIELAQQVCTAAQPENTVNAEYLWGIALSHEGINLVEAAEHLQNAEDLLRQHALKETRSSLSPTGVINISQIRLELGNIMAKQGNLPGAIAEYRKALDASQDMDTELMLPTHILAHNNLAYHLHLLNDPAALTYAQTGLALAREKGILSVLPYLLSTRGEIALAQSDLTTAEEYFKEGLSLAKQFNAGERIAGLTANLGLVATRQGQTALAIHRLSTALSQADALGLRFLATQIRLWLAPLLPPSEARTHLAEARAVAQSGGFQHLLAEIARLETKLLAEGEAGGSFF